MSSIGKRIMTLLITNIGEHDIYKMNEAILRLCGMKIEEAPYFNIKVLSGLPVNIGAKIILKPDFGVTLKEIRHKLKGLIQAEFLLKFVRGE